MKNKPGNHYLAIMKAFKLFMALALLIVLIQCSATNPTNKRKAKRQIAEYKAMTNYIIANNYHQNFRAYSLIYNWDKTRVTDSLLHAFMFEKNIKYIYIESVEPTDSIIEYSFMYMPVLGKKREIRFDLKKQPDILNYKGATKIENGIYYIEHR